MVICSCSVGVLSRLAPSPRNDVVDRRLQWVSDILARKPQSGEKRPPYLNHLLHTFIQNRFHCILTYVPTSSTFRITYLYISIYSKVVYISINSKVVYVDFRENSFKYCQGLYRLFVFEAFLTLPNPTRRPIRSLLEPIASPSTSSHGTPQVI